MFSHDVVQIAVIHDSIHLRFCESVATTKWYSATEQCLSNKPNKSCLACWRSTVQ